MDQATLDSALLRLDAWDQLTSLQRQQVTSEVAHHLPRSFSEEGLETRSLGGRTHETTFFLELCEGMQFRGGDGGIAVCGGFGRFLSWIPLASSFRIPEDEDIDGWCIEEVLVRRVFPMPSLTGR